MRKALAMMTFTLAGAVAAALSPAAIAAAAPSCVESCVVTVAPGAQSNWAVPANASDVSVVVAGGSGGDDTFGQDDGGTGGKVTVDLGTDYNGRTLYSLVGAVGARANGSVGSGGGGSYVATTSGFVVVAGGGGGGGTTDSQNPAAGGSGGYSTASADGGAGADYAGFSAAGTGAVGVTPGQPSSTPGLLAYGQAGSVALVSSNGTITPGVGGSPSNFSYPAAEGGGGYSGGGGGSSQNYLALEEAGSGGGGSGFLAAGLTASATVANAGAGSITFTYSLQATITAPTASLAQGAASSTTVGTLPASTAFTVIISGLNTQVASGTTNANGDPITVNFAVPTAADIGSHTLALVVGGTTVATSTAFTVVAAPVIVIPAATLASTGLELPWWLALGAGVVMAAGVLLVRLAHVRQQAN